MLCSELFPGAARAPPLLADSSSCLLVRLGGHASAALMICQMDPAFPDFHGSRKISKRHLLVRGCTGIRALGFMSAMS